MAYQQLGSAQADATPVYSAMSNQLDRGNLLNRTAQSNSMEAQKFNVSAEQERQYRKAQLEQEKWRIEQAIKAQDEADDESFWGDIIGGLGKTALSFIPGVGPLLSAGVGAATNMGKSNKFDYNSRNKGIDLGGDYV
jgi:hypothetical protein